MPFMYLLPPVAGMCVVGRMLSFAESEMKNPKGTNQRHIVKYAITLKETRRETSTSRDGIVEQF